MTPSTLFAIQFTLIPLLPYLFWRLPYVAWIAPLGVVQILFGFLLSPIVLGSLWHRGFEALLPAPSRSALDGVGWISIMLFVSCVATDVEPNVLSGRRDKILAISTGSLIVPFILGTGLGELLAIARPELIGLHASPGLFALAIGACTAITALPILSLIVRDLGLTKSPFGQLAMAVAVVDDALLWILLAILSASAHFNTTPTIVALQVVSFTVLWLLGAFLILRPLLTHLERQGSLVSETSALMAFLAASASCAAAADFIGLHLLVGAFVGGLVVPASVGRRAVTAILPLLATLFLPFFFVSSALKADISYIGAGPFLSIFAAVTVTAAFGKLVGTAFTARAFGETWANSCALGALLQAKGLIEIVALRVFVDARVISPTCFSAFLLMALTTTVLAKPIALFFLRNVTKVEGT